MSKKKPQYYGYNIDFAKRYGIIASVLMGRIWYEMKMTAPNKSFVFDMDKASSVYTDEIREELPNLERLGLIKVTDLRSNSYNITVTQKGIYEFVYNIYDHERKG